MHSEIGDVEVKYSKSRIPLYYFVKVDGKALNRSRILRNKVESDLLAEALELAEEWDGKWDEVEDVRTGKRFFEKKQINEYFVQLSNQLTNEAELILAKLDSVLVDGLEASESLNWDDLKNNLPFIEPRPYSASVSLEERFSFNEPEPKISDEKYKPQIGLLGKLFGGSKSKDSPNIEVFNADHSEWLKKNEASSLALIKAKDELSKWESKSRNYSKDQADSNQAVDQLKSKYFAGDAGAIVEYCDIILGLSDYPECIKNVYDIEYTPSTKTLLIEFLLPNTEDLPKIKEWKFIATKGLLSPKELADAELNRRYDDLIYQTALRVIHEIFNADELDCIDAVVFNGRIKFINTSTGHPDSACILSIQASKDEFMAINLAHIKAKDCFKALKGVASSKLYGKSAIAPILNMRREDGRFVSAQEIANTVNDSTNLAAMDWQDFEHLIREIFEKEFSANGGEVKITQASRDGGVDAIAFDPDPIRGGKIVIQAKRYTNTVTVSAVRDLYGTVMNEGATKGILVTTSDYGPDAYNFIKDKPLSLLNGSNLLYLLEKHGHKARIDIQEAKLING